MVNLNVVNYLELIFIGIKDFGLVFFLFYCFDRFYKFFLKSLW